METVKAISEFICKYFNRFIIGIIAFGLLIFFNMVAPLLININYSTKNQNIGNKILFAFFTMLMIYSVLLLPVIMIGRKNFISAPTILSMFLNIVMTVVPYSLLGSKILFYFRIVVFFATDIYVSGWISVHASYIRKLFIIKETKKVYKVGETHIEETEKNYPIILSIIIAIIGASGAIISATIK